MPPLVRRLAVFCVDMVIQKPMIIKTQTTKPPTSDEKPTSHKYHFQNGHFDIIHSIYCYFLPMM